MKKVKVFIDKDAEDFLKSNGFDVAKTIFIKKEEEVASALSESHDKIVMKVSGEDIVHKTRVGGVKMGISDYKGALAAFRQLKKIKGFQGVLVQKQVKGEEFLLGLKKTKDFGHVVAFAKGGSKAEKIHDVAFRVCGVDGVNEIIKDVKAAKNLKSEQIESIEKILVKLCNLADKHKDIKALDINPLILEGNRAVIVDVQIEFE